MRKIKRIERALREGDWYNQVKGTQVFADIAIGVGLVVGAGAAVYTANKQGQIANSEMQLQNIQLGKQNTAFDQLQQLISNPGAFFDSPVYKAAAAQGSSAVARENAAAHGANSGNEAQALQAYGQSFGQQQLLGQEQLLAGMSGTGFNPAAAGGVALDAINAQGKSLQSIGGMLSFFGSKGGGGDSTAVTFGGQSPAIDTSGVVSDTPISSGPW